MIQKEIKDMLITDLNSYLNEAGMNSGVEAFFSFSTHHKFQCSVVPDDERVWEDNLAEEIRKPIRDNYNNVITQLVCARPELIIDVASIRKGAPLWDSIQDLTEWLNARGCCVAVTSNLYRFAYLKYIGRYF